MKALFLILIPFFRSRIQYGNPDASMEQVIEAARVAGIHEFVCNLPQGYETLIGEKGVKLSEGQRQRLSVTRALVKDPDILILDEPTSALDSLTENWLFNSLPSLVRCKTLFVISHQLSTIENPDRVLLLNDSLLIALGTHRSLWEDSEYYRLLLSSGQVSKV